LEELVKEVDEVVPIKEVTINPPTEKTNTINNIVPNGSIIKEENKTINEEITILPKTDEETPVVEEAKEETKEETNAETKKKSSKKNKAIIRVLVTSGVLIIGLFIARFIYKKIK
jgi:cell division protein FtsX